MSGKVNIDINALNNLVNYLLTAKTALHNQKQIMSSLNTQLDMALTGNAPSVVAFDTQFSSWTTQLDTVTDEMDQAYTVLHKVLVDTMEAINTLCQTQMTFDPLQQFEVDTTKPYHSRSPQFVTAEIKKVYH